MATIESRAALDGNKLRLEVSTVNRRAVRFHEPGGFSVDGVVSDPVTAWRSS